MPIRDLTLRALGLWILLFVSVADAAEVPLVMQGNPIALGAEPVVSDVDTVLKPVAYANGILWAVKFSASNVVYTRSDGETRWTKSPHNLPANCMYAWPLASGVILYGNDGNQIYRATVNRGDVSAVKVCDLGLRAASFLYSVAQSPSAVVLGEYGTAKNGPAVWYSSTDGLSWTKVLQFTASEATHVHHINYHEATGRFILSTGDGSGQRRVKYSEDGIHWDDLVPGTGGYTPWQAVQMYDYGDPVKVLCATDTDSFVFTLNVLTGETTLLGQGVSADLRSMEGCLFSILRSNGVYYAAQFAAGSHPIRPWIVASTDLAHWTAFGRLTGFPNGAKFIGVQNGEIHLASWGSSSVGHYIVPNLSSGSISSVAADRFDPAAANRFTAIQSECESTQGWEGAGCSIDTSGALSGAGCLHSLQMLPGNFMLKSPGIAPITGTSYTGLAWVRGRGGVISVRFMTTPGVYGPAVYHNPLSDQWVEIRLPSFTAAGTTPLRLVFEMLPTCPATVPNSMELFVDQIQITALPECGTWTPGGSPRGEIPGAASRSVAGGWSSTYVHWAGQQDIELSADSAGKYFLRSWVAAPDACAQLYWDVFRTRFALDVTDGLNSESLYGPASTFLYNTQLITNVTVDTEARIHCHVNDGTGWVEMTRDGVNHGTANAYVTLATADLVERYGDCGGGRGLPGWGYSRTECVVPDRHSICVGTDAIWKVAGGFGSGGVQYYKYAWDQKDTYAFAGTESIWSNDALSLPVSTPGNWYLHVQGYDVNHSVVNRSDVAVTAYPATAVLSSPGSVSLCPGKTATFSVNASGANLSYQWQKNQVDLSDGSHYSGATSLKLNVIHVDSDDNGSYRCVVTGACGTAVSSPAVLNVGTSTFIVQQPVSQSVAGGSSVQFDVVSVGAGPMSYQWKRGDVDLEDDGHLSGSKSPELIIYDVNNMDAGNYLCVVTADCTVMSYAASLTVYLVGTGCGSPRMDISGDLHVDSNDFDFFSACYNGPTNLVGDECKCVDINGDHHVDAIDFDAFSGCYNGPVNPPACM